MNIGICAAQLGSNAQVLNIKCPVNIKCPLPSKYQMSTTTPAGDDDDGGPEGEGKGKEDVTISMYL